MNRFINSQPVPDGRLADGDHEDYNLTHWNDTPPHENGEGWDGTGFGAADTAAREMSGTADTSRTSSGANAADTAQPYSYVEP